MPQGLANHQSQFVTKLLNMGEPGSGKTGGLACLAKAGYKLIIADFDNGLDILLDLLKNDQEAMDRVTWETFTDTMKAQDGRVIAAGIPKAFTSAMNGLTKWEFPIAPGSSEKYNLGNVGTWGSDTILVIDSLGFVGSAALRFVRQMAGHQLDNFTSIPDYGQAMERLRGLLELLRSDGVKCNVIVNTHITYIEDEKTKVRRGLPRALGSKLPPDVGGYFNSVVATQTIGGGSTLKRRIRTSSDGVLELKLPVGPGVLPDYLPLSDGLLTIFKKLQKEGKPEDQLPPTKPINL